MREPIRQIAYFVPDIRAAAIDHARHFGSGPFFVRERIPVPRAWHRGQERTFDHGSAYGQWGPVMVEFVQQNNTGPSPLHDVYPEGSGRFGLHHTAVFVEQLGQALDELNGQGFETALYAEMGDGFAFAMVDTVAAYGHMVELYEPVPALRGFYDLVADAARGFDGAEPLRELDAD